MRAIRGWRCDRIQEKWYIYNFLLHRGNSGMTTGTEDTVQITSGTLRAPSTFLWRPVYRSVVSLTRGNTRRGKKNLRSISTSIIPISGINTHTHSREPWTSQQKNIFSGPPEEKMPFPFWATDDIQIDMALEWLEPSQGYLIWESTADRYLLVSS